MNSKKAVKYIGGFIMNRMFTEGRSLMGDFFDIAERCVQGIDSIEKVNYTRDLNSYVDKNDDGYTIVSEVPGLVEEDLKIELKDGTLTIDAEYKKEDEFSLREGKYSWSCKFVDIDPESIKATLKDGVLKIFIQKNEEAKPKLIKINSIKKVN